MKAHQRLIREEEAARDPRAVLPLDGARVEKVSREWAEKIIHRYEWLGTIGHLTQAYGLLAADDTPMGVACFGMPGGTASRDVCGQEWRDRTIALNRGACVHYAHPHAASFLIPRAVKLAAQDYGWRVFIAYSDEEAGEIGTVYQACNWLYLGVGNGRGKGGRPRFRNELTGEVISSRVARRRFGSVIGLTDAGWVKEEQKNKGRYVTFAGTKTEKRDALRALRYKPQPYPKRST